MSNDTRRIWLAVFLTLFGTILHAGVTPNCASVCGGANSVTTDRLVDGAVTPAKVSEWAPTYVSICNPGTSAASVCAVMTAQGAGPDPIAVSGVVLWDTTNFHSFRLYVLMGNVAATTMDLTLQCDTTSAFASATTMVTITQADLTSGNLASSVWTTFSANECKGADVYMRVVAVDGDGIASPVIRKVYLGLK